MKAKFLIKILTVISFLTISFTTIKADSNLTIRVLDRNNSPIDQADVFAFYSNNTYFFNEETNSTGYGIKRLTLPDNYIIEVNEAGYDLNKTIFILNNNTETVYTVILTETIQRNLSGYILLLIISIPILALLGVKRK